jgi:hypothetical protein
LESGVEMAYGESREVIYDAQYRGDFTQFGFFGGRIMPLRAEGSGTVRPASAVKAPVAVPA